MVAQEVYNEPQDEKRILEYIKATEELKRGNYEVRTTGRDGERIKLYVNAKTGDILGQRDARKGDDHTGGVIQKLIGNCNERRCRDDLVSTPADLTPTKP